VEGRNKGMVFVHLHAVK